MQAGTGLRKKKNIKQLQVSRLTQVQAACDNYIKEKSANDQIVSGIMDVFPVKSCSPCHIHLLTVSVWSQEYLN